MSKFKLIQRMSVVGFLMLLALPNQFTWGSVFTTLDAPLGVNGTVAFGIDGSNIVGSYEDSNFKEHGFLYSSVPNATVPEPSMMGVMGVFGGLFGLFCRRKAKTVSA